MIGDFGETEKSHSEKSKTKHKAPNALKTNH